MSSVDWWVLYSQDAVLLGNDCLDFFYNLHQRRPRHKPTRFSFMLHDTLGKKNGCAPCFAPAHKDHLIILSLCFSKATSEIHLPRKLQVVMDPGDLASAAQIARFTRPLEGIKLQGATLNFKILPFELDNDEMYDIKLSCTYQSSVIAELSARLVHKDKIIRNGNSFYEQMDRPSDLCCYLAIHLFSGHGLLKPKWISDPALKGSGRWTSEDLDSTDFIVIEHVQVDTVHRRKGIGKEMMNAVLNWALNRGANIAFFHTVELRRPLHGADAAYREKCSRAMAFCRSVGFRRVGASHWFAHSTVRGPMPSWSADEDFDPEECLPGAGVSNT